MTRQLKMGSIRSSPLSRGFTIVELLIVIVVIGVLAALVMNSFTNAQKQSRDAIRATDMHTIYNMLAQYSAQYGGIPKSFTYAGGSDAGGWDYSSQPVGSPSFMSFLVTSGITTKVPVDPTNNMTGNSSPAGTYAYKYYCYPGEGLALGYTKETTGASVFYTSYKNPAWNCL